MLNAGVFAYRRDAPHCEVWAESIRRALHAGCTLMTDQFALNEAMYRRELLAQTELLPAWCNWVCHLCIPDWDPVAQQFLEPYLPHAPIGIVHLTAAKHDRVVVSTTAGEKTRTRLQYDPERERTPTEAPPLPPTIRTGPLPAGDYVSPGLEIVLPDAAFPHLVTGNLRSHAWPYLRKDIPHTWYVDRRFPQVGFCNRDEASILYNTARQFRNRPALEVGCWLGWSACHRARGRLARCRRSDPRATRFPRKRADGVEFRGGRTPRDARRRTESGRRREARTHSTPLGIRLHRWRSRRRRAAKRCYRFRRARRTPCPRPVPRCGCARSGSRAQRTRSTRMANCDLLHGKSSAWPGGATFDPFRTRPTRRSTGKTPHTCSVSPQ